MADLSGDAPTTIIDGQPFATWQSATGFDLSSNEGPVPGISAPSGAWLDPQTWNDPAFLTHFVPDASFAGCQGADTPGAFDCAGNRLGIVGNFGAENLGLNYGWMFTAYGVGGIIGPIVAGVFKDMGAGKGLSAWMPPFMLAATLCVLAAGIILVVKPPKSKPA